MITDTLRYVSNHRSDTWHVTSRNLVTGKNRFSQNGNRFCQKNGFNITSAMLLIFFKY